jgi:ribosomal protein S18 acetylase RimI-like enzyme
MPAVTMESAQTPTFPDGLPGYSARAATETDAPALAACARAAYAKYVERNGLVPVPMRQDYAEVVRDWQVTVVECDGEVAALVVMGKADEGFLLDNVAVAPEHQGRGLGRVLLAFAEEEARRQGFDSIYLYAQEVMTENIALYESIGYVEYARRRQLGLPRVYLRKRLTPGPRTEAPAQG